jgi:2-amino-4-hydroxy-6-hydroxymethyldihydropteridine diphosphokinase
VGFGANLGDAAATVRQAAVWLSECAGIRQVVMSSLYRTAPWEASGPDYINAVVSLDTCLTAPALLQVLQVLELRAGRERPYPNAPRTLDLDLLLYGQAHIQSATLTVPHPRMWARAFVLHPLADVAAERVPASAWQAVAGQFVQRLGD